MSESKRDLTDRALRALKPAAPGKRYVVWDAQVTGFGVRVTDRTRDNDKTKGGSVSFIFDQATLSRERSANFRP